MRHYCTLFDSKYLPQGLTLYESLKRHSSEPFMMHILGMDNQVVTYLHLNVCEPDEPVDSLFHIGYLEDKRPEMARLRESRTWAEYCWTCASNFTEFLMAEYGLPEITYLDADMMFFSDPEVIFDEIGERSIAVIPHRFMPEKKYLEVNGQFNVSWVTFKNDRAGRECLSIWAGRCRERCAAAIGCGDQGYLDEWPAIYGHALCVIQNIGAGLAPWNLANYQLTDGPKVDGVPVVFFHAHEYLHGERLTNYELRPEDIEFIYKPYIQAVESAKQRIESVRLPA
jgi:hypothetical protein